MAATTIPKSSCLALILLLITCSSPLLSRFSHAQKVDLHDTLFQGQVVKDGQTLVSSGQSFELGFFSPAKSRARYVGIWYKNITVQASPASEKMVVWVGNRDDPLHEESGAAFTFDDRGNLRVYDEQGYSFTITVEYRKGIVLKLLDSGNLVLKHEKSGDDVEAYFSWQSFDHPTDTILPGMRLGINQPPIVSWAGEDDPSSGSFSLGFNPYGLQQLFIWQKGTVFLGSTQILEEQIIWPIPKMFSAVFYLDQSELNFSLTSANTSSFSSRIVLDSSGKLNYYTWVDAAKDWKLVWTKPDDPCRQSHKYCGAFSICSDNSSYPCRCLEGFKPVSWIRRDIWSVGCSRLNNLRCQDNNSADGSKEEFMSVQNVGSPDDPQPLQVGSMEECRLSCQNNCHCTAYSASAKECMVWNGGLFNIRQLSNESDISANLYVRIVPTANPKGKTSLLWVVVMEVSILSALLLLFSLFIYYSCRIKRKQRKKGEKRAKDLLFRADMVASAQLPDFVLIGEGTRKRPVLPMLSFSSVATATNNFSFANKLGQSIAAPVYKGILSEGQQIAVRKFLNVRLQDADDFRNEVSLLAELQHVNLVKLIGCCIEREEMMLVYEYMPNKSLDLLIFDPTRKSSLDWEKRVLIIDGIAQGLLYLHKFSRVKIIHKNITASNILLDAEMNPKISGFSVARTFERSNSYKKTKRIVGTLGYMSPEYSVGGFISEKSDIFSFGILLLEIVSGQINANFHGSNQIDLPEYAWKLWKEGRNLELMDPVLKASAELNQVKKFIHVGLLCVQAKPVNRPNMSDVVLMLSKGLATLPSPQQPAFSCNPITLVTFP